MRLTIDHLRRAPQFTNAILEREIDLRGMSISMLDESALSLLENRFDVINLTANALTTLQYFPLKGTSPNQEDAKMDRVRTLIVHRNKIHNVNVASCVLALPSITAFLADRNQFATLQSLLFLRFWPNLTIVSIQDNPVLRDNPEHMTEAQLRAFLLYLCPKLKLINWQRVTQHDKNLMDEHVVQFKEYVVRSTLLHDMAHSEIAPICKVRKRARARHDNDEKIYTTEPQTTLHRNDKAETIQKLSISTTETEVISGEQDIQAKLNAIEARILADDVTAEEIVQLEQQMNELTVQLEGGKRKHTEK